MKFNLTGLCKGESQLRIISFFPYTGLALEELLEVNMEKVMRAGGFESKLKNMNFDMGTTCHGNCLFSSLPRSMLRKVSVMPFIYQYIPYPC